MFYCDPCAEVNKWWRSYTKSAGTCEICGKTASCNNVPSELLPSKVKNVHDNEGPTLQTDTTS